MVVRVHSYKQDVHVRPIGRQAFRQGVTLFGGFRHEHVDRSGMHRNDAQGFGVTVRFENKVAPLLKLSSQIIAPVGR